MKERRDEHYLVLKAQAGSDKAFAVLYRSYNPSLYRFAIRLCRNEQNAMDAVQDAWILIARTLPELTDPAMFRPRAFRAVRWRTIDYMRKRDNNMEQLEDDYVDESKDEMPWATPNQISALVAHLPEIEAQAIYLFYLEELSTGEIASIFEIPVGTVKSRLNRARTKLKTLLSDLQDITQ